MAQHGSNPKVDAFLGKAGKWRAEFTKLRQIILNCRLTEELKWGKPCYTLDGRNIVLMHGFNDYCALLFFKGAVMNDASNILVQQTENVQAARQIRFTDAAEIGRMENILTSYIHEAIKIEQSGTRVSFKKTAEFAVPDEFQQKLDKNPKLKAAFSALTPGRQRGYILYFGGAKQAKTREARIEKYLPKILDGKGVDD